MVGTHQSPLRHPGAQNLRMRLPEPPKGQFCESIWGGRFETSAGEEQFWALGNQPACSGWLSMAFSFSPSEQNLATDTSFIGLLKLNEKVPSCISDLEQVGSHHDGLPKDSRSTHGRKPGESSWAQIILNSLRGSWEASSPTCWRFRLGPFLYRFCDRYGCGSKMAPKNGTPVNEARIETCGLVVERFDPYPLFRGSFRGRSLVSKWMDVSDPGLGRC